MLLSPLEFGSLFTYTPKPENEEQKKAQTFVYSLKYDRLMGNPPIPITANIAKHIADNLDALPFGNFFGSDVTLVPAPSSTLKVSGALWVPYNLAKALEAKSLGQTVVCVERKNAVAKAATSRPEERPTPEQQYQSLKIEHKQQVSKKIVIIDDVITRGATAIGVASRLKEVYPDADIKHFAVVRTISKPKNFVEFNQSCIGKITIRKGHLHREP